MRQFLRDPAAVAALAVVVLLILSALLAPVLAPTDSYDCEFTVLPRRA